MFYKYKIGKTKAIALKRGMKIVSAFLTQQQITRLEDIIEQAQHTSISISEGDKYILEWAENSSDLEFRDLDDDRDDSEDTLFECVNNIKSTKKE